MLRDQRRAGPPSSCLVDIALAARVTLKAAVEMDARRRLFGLTLSGSTPLGVIVRAESGAVP
jgi:hypothetical protein